ncbi:MAG TPA: TlpA disulfide reductase family protein [Chitinophagaceae bacterium]
MYKRILIALIPILFMVLYSCKSDVRETDNNDVTIKEQPDQPKMLPSFAMIDAQGNTVQLESFKGKKVFVNLWATWCPPCRAEMPSIEELYSKTDKEKAVFIMLSLDDNFDKAKNYAVKQNMQAPIYYPAQNLPELLNTESIPATYIFNENGELVKHNIGTDDYSREEYVTLLNK